MAEKHHVVVDGSNLATEGRTLPSLAQLDEAVRSYADEDPGAEIVVVVDASFEHRIDAGERELLEQAELHGEVVSPPAGAIGRGDAFVLRIAERTGAIVLSNDSFQEFHGEHPWLFEAGRLIGGKPVPGVGWIFTPRIPVRGAKSRQATGRARRDDGDGDGASLPAPVKAAELAKAAKKVARAAKRAARLPDGSIPKIGDVWVEPSRRGPGNLGAPVPSKPLAEPGAPAEPGAAAKPGAPADLRAAAEPETLTERSAVAGEQAEQLDSEPARVVAGRKPKQVTAKTSNRLAAPTATKKATAAPTATKKATAAPTATKKAIAAPTATKKAAAAEKTGKKTAAAAKAGKKAAAAKAGKKAAAEKAPGHKATGKKVAGKKSMPEQVPAKRAAKQAVTKTVTANKKTPAKKAPAKQVAAKQSTAKELAARKPPAGSAAAGNAQATTKVAKKVAKKAAKRTVATAVKKMAGAINDPPGVSGGSPVTGPDLATAPRSGQRVTNADQQVREAIVEATVEALVPPARADGRAPKSRGDGKGASKSSKRRRRSLTPPPAVNEPLAFITFVATYPIGSTVEGEVASFTSHGAMVEVALPGGGGLHCYVPLAGLGDPPPTKAREVLSRGVRRPFVLVSLDPPRRVAELALAPESVGDAPGDRR